MTTYSRLAAGVALGALLIAAPVASKVFAADVFGRDSASTKDSGAAPARNWQGPFVYFGAGTTFATAEYDNADFGLGADVLEGAAGAGYNLQFGNLVLGGVIEGRLGDYGDDIDGRGMIAARLGYAYGNVLLYGLAGYERLFLSGSGDDVDGWTAGGGLEFQRGNGIVLGLESRYTDFDNYEDCFGTIYPEALTVTAKIGYQF